MMRLICRNLSLLVIGGLLASATLNATPALSGSSGLIRIPTAYTLSRGEIDTAIDMHWFNRAGPAADVQFVNSRFVLGLFDAEEFGAEIGVHRLDIDNAGGSGTAITGKYRFEGILPLGAFAIGGRVNVGGTDQNTAYIVGSTNASRSFAVHYGVGVNTNDARGLFSPFGGKDANLDSDRIFPMFGAELDWNDFKLNADYNGDSAAFGLNYYPMPAVVANVFFIDEGDMETRIGGNYSLGFGVSLQF